jgi:hypothetical protein
VKLIIRINHAERASMRIGISPNGKFAAIMNSMLDFDTAPNAGILLKHAVMHVMRNAKYDLYLVGIKGIKTREKADIIRIVK